MTQDAGIKDRYVSALLALCEENFQSLFSVVDDALAKDNMQALAMSLQSIIELAESSPFKDLQTIESTAAALTDPNHEWDF